MSSLKLHYLGKTTGPRTVGFLLTRFSCKCPNRKVAKPNKVTPFPDSGAFRPFALMRKWGSYDSPGNRLADHDGHLG